MSNNWLRALKAIAEYDWDTLMEICPRNTSGHSWWRSDFQKAGAFYIGDPEKALYQAEIVSQVARQAISTEEGGVSSFAERLAALKGYRNPDLSHMTHEEIIARIDPLIDEAYDICRGEESQ